jgi:acyl-CoA hydrolase
VAKGVTRPLVVYADGPGSARSAPADVVAAAGLIGDPDVIVGWTLEDLPWLASPSVRGRTTMAGYAVGGAVADGRLVPVSVRLSAIPMFIAHAQPDVCVVGGIRRGDQLVFGSTVGWGPAAARAARFVVVEIDEDGFDFGGDPIPGNIVATLLRPPLAADAAVPPRTVDEIDLRIGAHVMSILPDDATLQFGPGGIGEGVARAIDRPVGLWSGLVTDAMAEVAARGFLRGRITAGYVQGGEPVRELARVGLLDLQPIEVTHDLTRISSIDRFVSCNTALQVGLDGSVNIERVNGRTVTSIGGHSDFCAAATRSYGGLSVIALRSTTRRGDSTIVPAVETVSTQRSDVSAVVTEHGVADLRGVGDQARARLIMEVAAPEHRDALRAALR